MVPLTDLLKKDKKWEWSSKCQATFDQGVMSIELVLRLPNLEFPFEVQNYASDKALGGVLMQEGHPVAFESQKINGDKQGYNTHMKEMIIVIHCLQQ